MPPIHPKTVIVITGPTAAGKTDLAILIAQHYHTAVISADSRQCYREMTIGTAKPSESQLKLVPHYFINSHSVTEPVNAAVFERLALGYASEIFRHNDVAVLCGGTGLYVRAFLEGLDPVPAVPEAIRQQVRELYHTIGLAAFREHLREKDPQFYRSGENKNPQRLMRALEVLEATGRSILVYRSGKASARAFRTVKIGLEWPRAILAHRIRERTTGMIAGGLVKEVQALLPFRNTTPLKTVGYQEIFRYLDGEISLENAADQISTHTRQYAKRQMTWFKKDGDIHWYDPLNRDQMVEHVLHETGKFA